MKKYILIVLSLVSLIGFSQEENTKFKISFETNLHSYKMEELNQFLTDTSSFLATSFDSSNISSGTQFGFSLSYLVHPVLAIGIESSYQYGIDKRNPAAFYTDPFTSEKTYYSTDSEIKATNLSLGLNMSLSLDKIARFNEKSNFLNKVGVDFVVSGGVGISELTSYQYFPYFNSISNELQHQSTDMYFSGKLKLGYQLTSNPIFSQVGFNFGYQLMRTKPLRNDAGFIFEHTIYGSREVQLDFSGIFYGLYLTIGK